MDQHMAVGGHRFSVDGKTEPLYGGAVHYWRLDRDKWDSILQSVKDMGFTSVTSYIPWEIHEIEPGVFDFGDVDPRKDIDAFITLAESKGLSFVARPGPQINSEMTYFGYPKRILDDSELHALNGRGTRAVLTQAPRPVPVLSYSEDKFFAETAAWYDQIIPILAKHVYPKGNLLAVQVDNEMAYFFCINAYAADFSPSSVRQYQGFLEEKYGDIETLNSAYRSEHASFGEVDPPRRFSATDREDVPYYIDWAHYREQYLIRSMVRLTEMMKERGLVDVPIFHNYPHPLGPGGAASGFTTPFDLAGLEEHLDFVGFDFYSKKTLYDHVKTVVSYIVGTSRFPYIPEFIAGVWPWYLRPRDKSDEEFVTKAALMHGIKGFSRYTLVEREKWLDSPIRRDGRVRPQHAAMFSHVNEMALKHDFASLRRSADVLLLANRDYDRLEAASVLVSFPGDFLETASTFSEYPEFKTVSESPLGFSTPIQVVNKERFNESYRRLTESGVAFTISDTNLSLERWQESKAVILNIYDFLSAALQERVIEYAKGGGYAFIGPRLPDYDERIHENPALAQALGSDAPEIMEVDGSQIASVHRLGEGAVVVVEDDAELATVVERCAADQGWTRFTVSDPRLDVTIHRPVDDQGHLIVFAANPTGEVIAGSLDVGLAVDDVVELWTGSPVESQGSEIRDRFDAYSIRIYQARIARSV